ncbi:hypothetical protein SISSUDRAFT_1047031 [Sistotremastrum suecicum HHB10207 ss-3]|uniref:Uncharacterized protein n=1 Tax=Sistotremastrum suecicum HHB10207 ss-3 TaxID=1314776 RepID=A0A166DF56_9AGAM|nr:hypothetical protein SISSUDRAFT_1047031 [Sistotremastrum suecicum HHB10207 ss-3]
MDRSNDIRNPTVLGVDKDSDHCQSTIYVSGNPIAEGSNSRKVRGTSSAGYISPPPPPPPPPPPLQHPSSRLKSQEHRLEGPERPTSWPIPDFPNKPVMTPHHESARERG